MFLILLGGLVCNKMLRKILFFDFACPKRFAKRAQTGDTRRRKGLDILLIARNEIGLKPKQTRQQNENKLE